MHERCAGNPEANTSLWIGPGIHEEWNEVRLGVIDTKPNGGIAPSRRGPYGDLSRRGFDCMGTSPVSKELLNGLGIPGGDRLPHVRGGRDDESDAAENGKPMTVGEHPFWSVMTREGNSKEERRPDSVPGASREQDPFGFESALRETPAAGMAGERLWRKDANCRGFVVRPPYAAHPLRTTETQEKIESEDAAATPERGPDPVCGYELAMNSRMKSLGELPVAGNRKDRS